MGYILGHLMRKIFLALGGFTIWLYAILAYYFLSKDIRIDLGYYLFEDFEIKNNSGFTIQGIRFFIGILTFIAIILLINMIKLKTSTNLVFIRILMILE